MNEYQHVTTKGLSAKLIKRLLAAYSFMHDERLKKLDIDPSKLRNMKFSNTEPLEPETFQQFQRL